MNKEKISAIFITGEDICRTSWNLVANTLETKNRLNLYIYKKGNPNGFLVLEMMVSVISKQIKTKNPQNMTLLLYNLQNIRNKDTMTT